MRLLIVFVICMALALPQVSATNAVLNEFIGFETGGADELYSTAGSINVTDEITAQNSAENYSLKVAQGSSLDVETASYSDDATGMIIGTYAMCTPFCSTTVRQSIFRAKESKNNFHFQLAFDNNSIELYDVNDNLLDNSYSVTPDTWYLIEAWFQIGEHGNITVYVNGEEAYVQEDVNISSTGGSGSTSVQTSATAVLPGAGQPVLGSIYYMSNATSPSDFIGDYEVIAYQNRNASTRPDYGDLLNVGLWKDSGETPLNETNISRYTVTSTYKKGLVGSWTEYDGEIAGPYGDDRIDGNDNIIAGSWIHRYKGGFLFSNQKCYGDVYYGTINADSSTCESISNAGSFTTYREFSDNSSLVANASEYAQFGFRGRYNGLGDGTITLAEQWAMILHVPNVTEQGICIDQGEYFECDCSLNETDNIGFDAGNVEVVFINSGYFVLNATIYNANRIRILDGCRIRILDGGEFRL